MELEPGEVFLSAGAARHAASSHPTDYPLCRPHVAAVVTNPLFVGEGGKKKNSGKIELIGRVAQIGGAMLVAVCIEPDSDGRYQIASFYPIGEDKIENRRGKGYLKPCSTI